MKVSKDDMNLIDNLLFNYRLEQMRMCNWQEAERVTKILEKIQKDGEA